MRETLQDLLWLAQRSAAQTGALAADAAQLAAKKAEALWSSAQKNVQIMDLRSEMNFRFREVGELLYATHTGTPTDSAVLLEKLQGIDALKARLSALEQDGKE